MTTHQDTSTEHDLVSNMRALEADHEPDGWPAVRMSTISHLCDVIERMQAALASRDEVAQQPQGQTPDHSKLLKMIAHRARCFPSYPMGYHLPEVFAAIGEVPPEPQDQATTGAGQAVSDEQIDAVLKDIDHAARDYEVYEYGLPLHLLDGAAFPEHKDVAEGMRQPIRAILALRDKPEQRVPLSDDFATIAGLESAVGHLSTLVDEQRALLVESEDVFGRDGHGGRYEDGECNLIDRIRAHLEMTAPPPNGITAKEQGNGN